MPAKTIFEIQNAVLNRPINLRGKEEHSVEILKISFLNIECFFPILNGLSIYHHQEIAQLLEENISIFTLQINNLAELISHLELNKHIRPSLLFILESMLIKHNLNFFFKNKISVLSSGFYNQDNDLIKFKVTDKNFPEIIQKIKTTNAKKIRLDGNKNLAPSELVLNLSKLEGHEINKIEYFEEPCFDLSDSKKILNKFNIKLAIDEHFNLENSPDADIYILRPREYSLSRLVQFIDENPSKEFVISSSYDLDAAQLANILLAQYIDIKCKRKVAHGLDTLNFFDRKYFKNHQDYYQLSF